MKKYMLATTIEVVRNRVKNSLYLMLIRMLSPSGGLANFG
jgi:hypothetical protein